MGHIHASLLQILTRIVLTTDYSYDTFRYIHHSHNIAITIFVISLFLLLFNFTIIFYDDSSRITQMVDHPEGR